MTEQDWSNRFTEGEQKVAEAEEQTVRGLTKKQAEFFAAVRMRGMLNTMLETPAKVFEEQNPDMKCRWEWWPPNGDNAMVVAREAQGFRLVYAKEVSTTTSSDREGIVRRGDLVLMAGPKVLVDMIHAEDARAAQEDYKLSETAYREHLKNEVKVRLRDGTIVTGQPIGSVKRTVETIDNVREPQHELAEGGES